jgi:hypothetical protein
LAGPLPGCDGDTVVCLVVSHVLCLYAVAVTPEERGAILSVLEDPPDGLAELRGVLLREREWRAREGLV